MARKDSDKCDIKTNINYYSIDDCIDFCLTQARDDKNNTNKYLQIIKYLMNNSNPHFVYTYTAPNTNRDSWDWNTYSPLTVTTSNCSCSSEENSKNEI